MKDCISVRQERGGRIEVGKKFGRRRPITKRRRRDDYMVESMEMSQYNLRDEEEEEDREWAWAVRNLER